ncbi:MAG: HAD family hydrolase, partial [Armatimonadota bacterium]
CFAEMVSKKSQRVRCAAQSLNLAVGVSEVAAAAAADLERAMQGSYEVLPGAVATLAALRDAGYRLGLLSNCYVGAKGVAEGLGLGAFFACLTLSFEVGLCKPDPRLYYYVCERLGCEPTQAWFAGDGNDRELDGAKAAGLRTVLVQCATSAAWATTPSSGADFAAASIADVADIVLSADGA